MKKFASILMCGLLIAMLIFSGIFSSFAVSPTPVDKTEGSLTLTKYDSQKVTTDDDGNLVAKDGEEDIYVEGATFSAFKVLDFNGKVFNVSDSFKSAGVTVESLVNVSGTETGYISYGTTTDLEKQISKLQSFALRNNVTATKEAVTDADGKAKFDNLPLGVYLVVETAVPSGYAITTQSFLVTIPQWNQADNNGEGAWLYDIEALPKDEKLQVVKVIASSDDSTSDSYQIGDVIDYKVTNKVPNYGMSDNYPTIKLSDAIAVTFPDDERIDKFNAMHLEFKDIMSSALTLDIDSVKLVVGETELVRNDTAIKELISAEWDQSTDKQPILAYSEGGDYSAKLTKNDDGTSELYIDIAWGAVNELQGQDITLTYSAQLNNNAVPSVINKNTVTYIFSNDPTKDTSDPSTPGTPGTPDVPGNRGETSDECFVYTYSMDLSKNFNGLSAKDAEVDASGVAFEIRQDGVTMNLIKNGDGDYSLWTGNTVAGKDGVTYAVELEEKTDVEPTVVGTVVTRANPTSDGALSVKGLKAGEYDLQEVASIDGYTLITSPITILVEEVLDSVDNTVISSEVKATILSNDGNNQPLQNKEDVDGTFLISVNNPKKQFHLPQTGGLGLWMFTIAGGVMMAGAIIFISVIRKREAE